MKLKAIYLAAAILLVSTQASAQTPDEIAAAKAQRELIEAQAAIEKAKADLAEAKTRQLKADWLGSATAEEAKKKAEAEKAELLAKFPPTEAKALAGTVGVEGVKLLALPPVVAKMHEHALALCKLIPNQFVVYEAPTFQAMTAARVLQGQIVQLKNAHDAIRRPAQADSAPTGARIASFLAVGAVTMAVKTAADLAALFKTDIATGRVDIPEARAYFLTMMAKHCSAKVTFIPSSYLGELDQSKYDALAANVKSLIEANYATGRELEIKKADLARAKLDEKDVQDKIAALEKKGDKITPEERKELAILKSTARELENRNRPLVTLVAALEDLVKQTDSLVAALKIADPSGGGPLQNAARLLQLADRIAAADTKILDIDVKAEGVTILKNNLFTGQRLRIAGAALISYKVFDKAGKVILADVLTARTDFHELDLRAEH